MIKWLNESKIDRLFELKNHKKSWQNIVSLSEKKHHSHILPNSYY